MPNSGAQVKNGEGRESVARMIMAHFNNNTDVLKFNPNIEWIDRWGTNFTSMEAVMVYTDDPETPQPFNGTTSMGHSDPTVANPVDDKSIPIFAVELNGSKGLVVPGEMNNHQGSYITRSFRYKSDEMIDKTDMNRSTTEFSFDSNGIYDIQSVGQVITDGDVHAERRIDTLVKVYDVWRESTQRQFVNGTISQAATQAQAFGGAADGDHSGTIVRDAVNVSNRLALNTQPEPLVPIKYSLNTQGRNNELLDDVFRDSYGAERHNPYDGSAAPADVPDILANRVQPAGYDGQLVLASNTLSYDPTPGGDADTFLASYNGDLDTGTCRGNGREQAKTPNDRKVRVVDTIGLLGLLNDTQIDTDVSLTGTPGVQPQHSTQLTYAFHNLTHAMDGLNIAPLGNGRTPYWQNAMMRMGDLRTDGVFVSGPGIAGNDATLKYVVGQTGVQSGATDANLANEQKSHANFQINMTSGTTISMWAKPAWHGNDNRTHEFLNTSNPGTGSRAEACYLVKDGRVKWCNLYNGASGQLDGNSTFGISDAGSRNNDLGVAFEGRNTQGVGDWSDPDTVVYLQGGITGVPPERLDIDHVRFQGNAYNPESASFRIQPFRWHYVGVRINYLLGQTNASNVLMHAPPRPASEGGINPTAAQNKQGYLSGNYSAETVSDNVDTADLAGYFLRPFIDTERYPEAIGYVPTGTMSRGAIPNTLKRKYWSVFQWQGAVPWASRDAHGDWWDYEYGHFGEYDPQGGIGQPIAWSWADGGTKVMNSERVFGMDNLNRDQNIQIYRHIMEDGTYSVIDEFKLSAKTDMAGTAGKNDRVLREQNTSRYYLPSNPSSRALTSDACPYFTSQTLYQSLKGNGTAKTTPDSITVARVTWTVFTPRFMHENKVASGKYMRIFYNPQSGALLYGQNITDDATSRASALTNTTFVQVPFKGPFDYDTYNADDLSFGALGEKVMNNRKNRYASVNRPFPYEYPNGQAHATRGVEIEILNDTAKISGAAEAHRGYGDFSSTSTFINPDVENRLGSLNTPAIVQTTKLRYRVRFVYPIDPLADPGSPATIDPTQHYMLDTPVFDDISITYYSKPKIFSYRLVNE